MVCSFLAFSSKRRVVASDMAASSSATAFVNSLMSSVSFAMEASSWSISACKVSTASVFSLRVCSLVLSSVSHQPLCSASSLASSIKRTIKSLIIFLTFTNGSASTLTASAESTRLFKACARSFKNSEARCCGAREAPEARNCASEEPDFCASEGKYVSALPDTAPLEMISMALVMASISSARSCCLDSKSEAFCSHVAVKSARYCTSASLVVVVSVRSPWASALACNFFALISDFSSRSCVA
mmetsp:Transcript_10324/g.17947  ORF Transcript_10324/g.17947 Transcript_10324/m.17947 type:complete len:243 (-) Transcript_10324:322-1050(-)